MKRLTGLYVVAFLLIRYVVAPMISTATLTAAGFVTPYIPPWLVPVNWVLGLFLMAICEGPILMPKYLSIALNVLLMCCILVFLGSWNLHPSVSPVISVLAFVEMNWLIPLWEAKLNPLVGPTPDESFFR